MCGVVTVSSCCACPLLVMTNSYWFSTAACESFLLSDIEPGSRKFDNNFRLIKIPIVAPAFCRSLSSYKTRQPSCKQGHKLAAVYPGNEMDTRDNGSIVAVQGGDWKRAVTDKPVFLRYMERLSRSRLRGWKEGRGDILHFQINIWDVPALWSQPRRWRLSFTAPYRCRAGEVQSNTNVFKCRHTHTWYTGTTHPLAHHFFSEW